MKSFLLEQENLSVVLFSRRDWAIRDANKTASRLLGVDKKEITKRRLVELVRIPADILSQIKNTKVQPTETVVEAFFFLPNHAIIMGMIVRLSASTFYFLFFSLEEMKRLFFLPQLRYFIKNIRYVGVLLDSDGKIKYASQMFCKLLGYKAPELIDKNFFDLLFYENEIEFYANQFKIALKNNTLPKSLQLDLKRRDGKIVQILWNLNLLRNERSETIGFSGMGINLDYLAMESGKTTRNERLETIIAKIAKMFAQTPTYKIDKAINWTLQIVGEYANVDRSYLFLFRNNQQIMVNTHEWCADGIEPQIENLQEVPSKTFPWWMKHLLKHEIIHIPQVSELPPEASAEKEILQAQDIQSLIVTPLIENDELIGFIGFDSVRMPKFWPKEDINLLKIIASIFVSSLSRKEAELSLADSERKYRTLFSTAPDLIFILNTAGEIESLNPAFTAITKQNIEDWIGKPFADLIIPGMRSSFKKRFKDCLTGEFQQPHELKLQAPGGVKIIEAVCSPFSFGGKVHGVYGIARDITDRKLLEETLHHAERMKSVGLLAGGIAHDFNNILGIIQGNYTLLKESLGELNNLKVPLESIRQAVERGKTLVQNLLTFARKKEPRYEILNLTVEIKTVINLLKQTTPKTIKYQLKLFDEDLFILSDQIQIHQLLLNLCLNAIDAIRATERPGKIIIQTEPLEAKELPTKFNGNSSESYIHLTIKDTGIGMPQDEVKFIFDPFYTTKEGGTGLGLSVVFGIVKSMNGFIDVESKVGKGTTFHLFLPAVKEKIPTRQWKRKVNKNLLFGSARIFLIEDDVLLSQMLSHLLETHGYKVTSVFEGDKAVEIYEQIQQNIDLVILDYDLPEKDGLTIAKEFKRMNPDVKIILTSGFIEPEIKQQMDRLSNLFFIEKPYDPEKILEQIPIILNATKKG